MIEQDCEDGQCPPGQLHQVFESGSVCSAQVLEVSTVKQ